MRITFMIGNGFDIGIGLRSSYTAFYENDLLKQDFDNPIVNRIRNDLYSSKEEGREPLWSDLEVQLGNYTPGENENPRAFLDALDQINGRLEAYLLSEQEKALSQLDYQIVVKRLTETFSGFYKDPSIHRNFRNLLQARIYNTFSAITYSVINFNFTSTMDSCLKSFSDSKTILKHKVNGGIYEDKVDEPFHVHGSISDGVVIGVDNENQIIYEPWQKDSNITTLLIKHNNNEQWGEDRTARAETIINESGIVCVYGMSLGITDLRWWNKLIQWLKSTSNTYLVIATYSDKPNSDNSTISYHFMKQDIRDRLKEMADCSEKEWNSIQNRICICQNPKWFDFR